MIKLQLKQDYPKDSLYIMDMEIVKYEARGFSYPEERLLKMAQKIPHILVIHEQEKINEQYQPGKSSEEVFVEETVGLTKDFDYSQLTKKELSKILKDRGLEHSVFAKKDTLIKILMENK
jgi:hypothetical protein